MNKKWLPYLIILVLGVTLFFIKKCRQDERPGRESTAGKKQNNEGSGINRNRGFDRRVSYLEFTQHAKCRMECRRISEQEVKEIMLDGKINYNKTNVDANPCPAYALEGTTSDAQHVRIVFGQCDKKTKVITVIDLDTEWSCDCPGDDDKYKNRN